MAVKVTVKEMGRCRYNLEDLLTQLREKGISDPSLVDYAILETSGHLSVILKEKPKLTTSVIMDGTIMRENLIEKGYEPAHAYFSSLRFVGIRRAFCAL